MNKFAFLKSEEIKHLQRCMKKVTVRFDDSTSMVRCNRPKIVGRKNMPAYRYVDGMGLHTNKFLLLKQSINGTLEEIIEGE